MLHLEKRKNSEERRCSPLFQIDHRTSSCITHLFSAGELLTWVLLSGDNTSQMKSIDNRRRCP